MNQSAKPLASKNMRSTLRSVCTTAEEVTPEAGETWFSTPNELIGHYPS
ncbi:hypothetical protein [Arthrobacter sp. Br18]|nr:hypothetical protein [Arthrobacter sp. Br18]